MKQIFTIALPILVFHLLFYQAELGLNVLLFSTALTIALILKKPFVAERKESRILLVLWNISAIAFVLNDSALTAITYWFLFFISLAYFQPLPIHFWVVGLIESLRAFLGGWLMSLQAALKNIDTKTNYLHRFKTLALLFIPLIIVVPFVLVYKEANSDFAIIVDHIWSSFTGFFSFKLNGKRLAHILLAIVVVSAAVGERRGMDILYKIHKDWSFDLIRKKRKSLIGHKMLALKKEYWVASSSFISLNALLAFVNILDFVKVWINNNTRSARELSQYVHEGTFLLIFSIFMAMLVVLIFFRGNLNFYKKNQFLLQLTYLWLAQNIFLIFSVAIRNTRYIAQYGLAGGRIFVFFFLLLTAYGLYSMYIKVREKKSLFYLVQKNGWAFVFILSFSALFNWESLITRYNLSYYPADTYYLTHMLHNNLLPLTQHVHKTPQQETLIHYDNISHKGDSQERRWQKSDWRSWTYYGNRQYDAWQALKKKHNEQ